MRGIAVTGAGRVIIFLGPQSIDIKSRKDNLSPLTKKGEDR